MLLRTRDRDHPPNHGPGNRKAEAEKASKKERDARIEQKRLSSIGSEAGAPVAADAPAAAGAPAAADMLS